MSKKNKKDETIARLKWACRRGMLELDVLLMGFLNEKYAELASSDQALFALMLDQPDPDLFSWLLGNQMPDEKFIPLVSHIRQHAKFSL